MTLFGKETRKSALWTLWKAFHNCIFWDWILIVHPNQKSNILNFYQQHFDAIHFWNFVATSHSIKQLQEWSNCETQRLTGQKLSSTIFTCCCLFVCLSRIGDISTIWCFRLYKPYIFWKLLVPGYQNWYYQVSHTKIHKYKYTNTQIQHINSAVKTHHVAYFWKEDCSRISKRIFSCVKHTITKIQIQNT